MQLAVAFENPWRGRGVPVGSSGPSVDIEPVQGLLSLCPKHAETPLFNSEPLAQLVGASEVWIKDERPRMGLGSFKALGAVYAIARDAAATEPVDWSAALDGRVYATASAGNHGLSVAAGSRIFGAQAVIYIADTVPEGFARRLAEYGAKVVREGHDYEASMAAAQNAAAHNGWTLLSDSSWDGYADPAMRVMEGYLQFCFETAKHLAHAPTHIFVQAGVGGMAAAVAAYARHVWQDAPRIIVVEPAFAPALVESVRQGALVDTTGPESSMGRLDCKTPSLVALAGLSRDADVFVTITEEEAAAGVETLARHGLDTTPSGGAGLAAVLAGAVPLGPDARVLTILSEGSERG